MRSTWADERKREQRVYGAAVREVDFLDFADEHDPFTATVRHLKYRDESSSVCGQRAVQDAGVYVTEHGDAAESHDERTCKRCLESWELLKRADRESRGEYVPPVREHAIQRVRRHVAPQVRTQAVADAVRAQHVADDDAPNYFRMLRADLEANGSPEAIAELERRAAKRAAKRAKREAGDNA